MAVSLSPPKRKAPSEAQIEAVINKGGKPTVEAEAEPTVKHFNIRLTGDILTQIDGLRAKRPRKPGSPKLGVSTHDWIVEAVLEKLKRDSK
ncbi:hypothetical protein [Spirosoma arcticum]